MQPVFQAFRSISLGTVEEDTAAAEALLREDIPRAYQLPAGGRLSIRPGRACDAQEVALLDEIVQHLIDLAYLPEAFYQDYFGKDRSIVSPAQWHRIQGALTTFMYEDDWVLQQGLLTENYLTRERWSLNGELLPLLVQRLNHLVSLDGEHLLDRPLKLGEQSVYSRVLQYRLRILGQYYDNELAPARLDQSGLIRAFNVLVLLGLKDLEEINFQSEELSADWFHILGNIHRLFGHYLQEHADRVLFYQLPEAAEAKAESQWVIVWKNKFIHADQEKRFKGLVAKQTLLNYKQLKLHIQGRGRAATAFHSIQNKLGLRLVQLKLWMAGYYYGRIDGWWGALSHQALLDLLAEESIKKRAKHYLVPVEDNYQAVNFSRLGRLLSHYDAQTGPISTQEEQLMAAISGEEEAAIKDAIYKEDEKISRFYKASHKNRRRLYFGLKSLAASALRGIKRIFRWVKQKVTKIVGSIISFFKAITKRIREGMLVFTESFRRFLHFIKGKPIISMEKKTGTSKSSFLLTRFAFDADAVNFYTSMVSAALLKTHRTLVRHLIDGLSLFLRIANEVIHFIGLLASLGTPIGWIKLGFWVAKKVEEVLERKVRFSGVNI